MLHRRGGEDVPEDTTEAWNFDEQYLGRLIAEWRKTHPFQVQEIDRSPARKGEWRLDRSGWEAGLQLLEERGRTLAGVADAHLIRPGYGENWLRLRPLLEMALTPTQLAWADSYHDEWTEAVC